MTQDLLEILVSPILFYVVLFHEISNPGLLQLSGIGPLIVMER